MQEFHQPTYDPFLAQEIEPQQPWWKRWWQAVSDRVEEATSSVRSYLDHHQVVKIGSMEINLTAIWETVTAPVRLVARPFLGRASSRRSPQSTLQRVKLMRMAAILGLGGVLAGVLVFFILFAWYSRDLPKPGQIVRREGFSTKFYDREGQILYDLFDTERRNPITIDQVPEHLKQATIAIEDKDFYRHGGFDYLTILRIPYNIIFRQRVVGGSTLTQQLVKNVLLTNERSLARKFKEFVLSLQIERTFTKDEILEMYLNEAPYGGTAWGVGAAAETYFDKPVQELTLVESAILAGLPQRPTAYSPLLGKTDTDGTPLWKVRTLGVLRRMQEDGYISELGYEEAVAELENVTFDQGAVSITAPHFVFYVRDQLEEMFGVDVVERGGLKVTTTLDLELQKEAEEAVETEIAEVESLDISNGAALAMDPHTGEVLAMVGSRDYFNEDIGGQFNVVVDGLRQPGSSIKPVTYLAMIKRGYSPATMLIDVPTTFAANDSEKPYEPKNYDGQFRGPVSLRNSLGSSLNIPAVKSLAMVGVENFLQLAYEMGFETLEPTEENMRRFGLAVTLGGAEVHLIDTVSAYSAFANGGTKVEPVSILKVEDVDGSVLYEHRQVEGPEVMTEEEAFLINHILSDNNARLLAFGANSLLNTGRPIAVKTGTTNDQRDNWTIGWSQDIIVGTWVGNNDNSPMRQVASGITGASPIWRSTILAALELGYTAPEWEVPAGVEQIEVDTISGFPAHDDFPKRTDYIIKGTKPSIPDPIHTKLKLCRGENKLATQAKFAANDFEEKEFIVLKEDDPVSQDGRNRWMEGITNWINSQTDSRYKYPTEYCGESSDLYVDLRKPEHERKYDTEDIEVEVIADSGDGIEKIEIWVDGSVKETVNSREYKGKIHMGAGQHEVWAKAFSRSGKTAESRKVKIGTGGQDWKKEEPSPVPTPSPTPTPSPSPSPSVEPSVAPGGGPGFTPPGQET
ncbi:MAG TPA: transglycosylase domain-containing protein [Patescibacteria group bacterium]